MGDGSMGDTFPLADLAGRRSELDLAPSVLLIEDRTMKMLLLEN